MLAALKKFCGDYKKLESPFVGGNYAYASDGRMAVRIDLSLVEEKLEESDITGKIDELLAKCTKESPITYEFQSVPANYTRCTHCKGKGIVEACLECCGKGEIECCECGQDRECPKCNGWGGGDKEKCEECNGVGKVLEHTHTVLTDKLTVQSKFLCTIYENLKNVNLYAGEKYVYFTFEGGEGILLPINKTKT